MYNATVNKTTVVPFTKHIEVFGQTLTATGSASIVWGDDGREIDTVEFYTLGVVGFSEERKEIVFSLPVNIKNLSYKQMAELENALIDQHAYEIIETVAAQVA